MIYNKNNRPIKTFLYNRYGQNNINEINIFISTYLQNKYL